MFLKRLCLHSRLYNDINGHDVTIVEIDESTNDDGPTKAGYALQRGVQVKCHARALNADVVYHTVHMGLKAERETSGVVTFDSLLGTDRILEVATDGSAGVTKTFLDDGEYFMNRLSWPDGQLPPTIVHSQVRAGPLDALCARLKHESKLVDTQPRATDIQDGDLSSLYDIGSIPSRTDIVNFTGLGVESADVLLRAVHRRVIRFGADFNVSLGLIQLEYVLWLAQCHMRNKPEVDDVSDFWALHKRSYKVHAPTRMGKASIGAMYILAMTASEGKTVLLVTGTADSTSWVDTLLDCGMQQDGIYCVKSRSDKPPVGNGIKVVIVTPHLANVDSHVDMVYDAIVIDEAHKLYTDSCNSASVSDRMDSQHQYRANTIGIAARTPFVVMMSGSPVMDIRYVKDDRVKQYTYSELADRGCALPLRFMFYMLPSITSVNRDTARTLLQEHGSLGGDDERRYLRIVRLTNQLAASGEFFMTTGALVKTTSRREADIYASRLRSLVGPEDSHRVHCVHGSSGENMEQALDTGGILFCVNMLDGSVDTPRFGITMLANTNISGTRSSYQFYTRSATLAPGKLSADIYAVVEPVDDATTLAESPESIMLLQVALRAGYRLDDVRVDYVRGVEVEVDEAVGGTTVVVYRKTSTRQEHEMESSFKTLMGGFRELLVEDVEDGVLVSVYNKLDSDMRESARVTAGQMSDATLKRQQKLVEAEGRRLANIVKYELDTLTAQKFCSEHARLPKNREVVRLPDGTVIKVGCVVNGAKHPTCDPDRRRRELFMATVSEFREWQEGYDQRDVVEQLHIDSIINWFQANPRKMPYRKEQVELEGGRVVNVGLLIKSAKRPNNPKALRLRSILLEKVPAFQQYVCKTELGEIDRINRPYADKPTSDRVAAKEFCEINGLPTRAKGAPQIHAGVNVFSYMQIHKTAYSGSFQKKLSAREKELIMVDIEWLRTNVEAFNTWCIGMTDGHGDRQYADKPTSRRTSVKEFCDLNGLPSGAKGAPKMQNGVNVFSYMQIRKNGYNGSFYRGISAKEKELIMVDIEWLRSNIEAFNAWCIKMDKRADVRANKRQKLE